MVTTINAYSVSLGLDARSFIDSSRLSRKETSELVKGIEAARTPSEKFYLEMDKLEKAYQSGAIKLDVYQRLLDLQRKKLDDATIITAKLVKETKQLEPAIVKNNAAMAASSSGYDGLTKKITSLLSAYVGMQTVTKSIKLAIDAEQAAAQFEVLTGSMNDAKLLGQQIRDFAAVSPVSLSGAQNAAKTMLSFNIQVQDVQRNLKMLGDISGGNQQRFDSLTLAFSQMSAAGRLMGQDLLQFVAAGFNPLQEISRKTGESMIDLKKRMEDGAISTQEVTDAFISATSEGGKFDGMTEKMAETMGGKLAIASANLELSLTKLGTALGPLIIQLTDGMEAGTSAIDYAVGAVSKLADGMGLLVALTQDFHLVTMANKVLNGDLSDPFRNTNNYLDLLDKRASEAASGKLNPFSDAAIIERAQLEINAAAEGRVEREKEELQMIERLQREINNASSERIAKEEKKRFDMEMRLGKQALKNAEDYFERERTAALKLRDEIAKGPGGGIMADSNEAAKFMADQVNKALASDAVGIPGKPTQEQLVEIALKEYEQSVMQTAKADELAGLVRKLIDKEPQLARAR